MTISNRIYFLFALLILGVSVGAFAQKAQRSYPNTKNWQKVSTEFFDVYYAGGSRSSAVRVARYAEVSRYELGQLYDYRPDARYAIFYVDDLPRLALTHVGTDAVLKDPGVFPMPKLEVFVVHPGSNHDLLAEVKRKVAFLILKEFSYGNRLGGAIQNNLLINNIPWYSKGLTDFVGLGWTYEDEMWLHDVNSEHILDMALEGKGKLNQVLRKSIWQYIAHEYGEQKLAEIIYLVNISHSLETGIISVLGITLNTLTIRWREYVLSFSQANSKNRITLGQINGLSEIMLPGVEVIGFAYNPVQKLYALYLNKEGKHTVATYQPETEKLTYTGIKSSFANLESEGEKVNYPMAWTKDGNMLTTTSYVGHAYNMVFYDLQTEETTEAFIGDRFGKITSMDWSHSGRKIVLSALNKGRTDIYMGTATAEHINVRPLTNDGYDDLDPVWSYDDSQIYFASNRDSARLDRNQPEWKSLTRNFDIFSLYRGKAMVGGAADSLVQLTFTDDTDERKPNVVNSFEVMYLSDESGIHNLKKMNVFLRETSYVSNFTQGILEYSASENQLVFATPMQGKQTLFSFPMSNVAESAVTPTLTLLRMEKKAAFREKEKNRLEAEIEAAAKAIAAQAKKEDTKETPVPEVAEEDTEKDAEETKEKPRFYIFDDDEVPYETKDKEASKPAKKRNRFTLPTIFGDQPKPTFGEIKVSQPESAPANWSADYTGLYVGRRADAGYYIGVGAGFSDLLNNQWFEIKATPYIDFGNFRGKNGEAWLRYTNVKGKFDFSTELYGDLRNYRRKILPDNQGSTLDTTIYRNSRISLKGNVKYPISNFASWNAQLGIHTLGFDKIQPNANQQLGVISQRDYLASLGVKYIYNKTRQREGFYYQGILAEIGAESMFSTQEGRFAYHTISTKVKKYTKITRHIVFANQLQAAYSVGKHQQRNFLGGVDDWIVPLFFETGTGRNEISNSLKSNIYDFSFQELVMPIRGFWFFSKNGSKYVAFNNEVRIPISRLVKQSLNSNPLYNMELIPFLDVGSVWSSGNPFSQKNPTDTKIRTNGPVLVELQTLKSPFLFGFGTGFRTNLLGYSVRLDLAWGVDDNTLQKPVFGISMGKNF